MTTPMADIKGFYRQKKKSGISKAKTTPKPKHTSSPKHAALFGSDVVQSPALIVHDSPDLQDGYGRDEEVFRGFDMNMAYGPCLGMSRLARWERAYALGLHPPKDIKDLLKTGKTNMDCLWEGRV